MAARFTYVCLTLGDPDMSQTAECPCCRFDAVLTFPVFALSDEGVSRAGTAKVCGRCWNENCPCTRRSR